MPIFGAPSFAAPLKDIHLFRTCIYLSQQLQSGALSLLIYTFRRPGITVSMVKNHYLSKIILVLGFFLFYVAPINAQRISTELSNGWRFTKSDAAISSDTSTWQIVSVPHTWNLLDGEHSQPRDSLGLAKSKGKPKSEVPINPYYRGPGWYAHSLDVPEAWRNRRVFLQFEAASTVADVYLNGDHLGYHRGAFTAFAVELTSKLLYGRSNEIRVRVDNRRQENVAPLAGDFNMFGGLYRPVHLLVTDKDCITPLHMGSPGVFVSTRIPDISHAVIDVRSTLSLSGKDIDSLRLRAAILDAANRVVATSMSSLSKDPSVLQRLTLLHPHLWNGIKDPYLYSLHVSLIRSNKIIDEVIQPIGIRTVAITESAGFLLNGKPYPIYGVGRKQERLSDGWALTAQDELSDAQMIILMGATAVRDAHYPMSQNWHNICDRLGLLLWDEIPFVNDMTNSAEFAANLHEQLQETILQLNNHPSVSFWGLFNELKRNRAGQDDLLQSLKAQAKSLDMTRPIVGASNQPNASFNKIPEFIAFNNYPGWYGGTVSNWTSYIAERYREVGHRIAISEYGAGGAVTQHQEGPSTKPLSNSYFHPEEYEDYVHEQLYPQIKDNTHLWGTFVWVMFDFAANERDEGPVTGINNKGLVTHDHQLPKDAYFFYQANWTKKPMVYIASRRMIERLQSATDIHVYSNMSSVELFVNGRSFGKGQADNVHVFRWKNVILSPGRNHIQAIASGAGEFREDSCDWILLAKRESHSVHTGKNNKM